MNRAQEHLAQANGHIAELTVQIVRQRVIVKYALDTGQRSEIVEPLLNALEGSLHIFEKHRGTDPCSVAASTLRVGGSSKRLNPPQARDGLGHVICAELVGRGK